MRLCALAESSTERSAASDITLVLLSRSPVLTTQITSVFPGRQLSHVEICFNVKARSQDPTAPISALPCPESDEYD